MSWFEHPLSKDHQKKLLEAASYWIKNTRPRIWGRVIGYAEDHRGFGAVVGYQNRTKGFHGVDPMSLQITFLGHPPAKSCR